MENKISRKKFLAFSGIGAAALGSIGFTSFVKSKKKAEADLKLKSTEIKGAGIAGPPVVISEIIKTSKKLPGEIEIEKSLRLAIDKLGGLTWLRKGDRVLLKVSSNSANPYPAVTRPELVIAMASILKKEGAGEVIMADMAGVQTVHHSPKVNKGSTREVFRKNGLLSAAEKSGCTVHTFDEAGYDAFFRAESEHFVHWKGPVMIPDIIKSVNHIIYLNRISTHLMGGATLALKNAVGWLREDSRLELHRDGNSFMEKCAEINSASAIRERFRFAVSEASMIQTTIGPDFGKTVAMDTPVIVASGNIAMHDMAAWCLLQYAVDEKTGYLIKQFDLYPMMSSMINRAFVTSEWGSEHAGEYKGLITPSRDRDPKNNIIIRRGLQIFSPEAAGVNPVFIGNIPENIRNYVV
jgi:uncharacterized protein (DUF362 family)